jgi:uncharacterized membrane protein
MLQEFWDGFSHAIIVLFGWFIDLINIFAWNWEVVGGLTAFALVVVGGLAIFIFILNWIFTQYD